ncbi:MAG TPA: hypothetical protein VHZ76_08470, partial [Gammaproteobacteria bacterium]|nr:hypothetical protein [Gammaproteobacteria bacterium]
MTTLKKIACLINQDENLTFELEDLAEGLLALGIETKICEDNDSILSYQPDCVLITSPQDAKLTPFPTYGILNQPRDFYLETPRFLRNILTYDGYFTFSPRLKQMIGDVLFGARKLGSSIGQLDLFSLATEFETPLIDKTSLVVIFEPNFVKSHFKKAIYRLFERFSNLSVVTLSAPVIDRYQERFLFIKNNLELKNILGKSDITICLNSGDNQEEVINPSVIKLIAASTIVITHHTNILASYFGENLYFIPQDTYLDFLPDVINSHLQSIQKNPEEAIKKSRQAHQIFLQSFAFDNLLTQFNQHHEKTLIAKGYVPHPHPEVEQALPSVSYIIRTGGKHRPFLERTLDCLEAQQYPDMRVIFVTHAPVPYMDEIIKKYRSIQFKVIE